VSPYEDRRATAGLGNRHAPARAITRDRVLARQHEQVQRHDEIRTQRLLMRRWCEADREPFAVMNADPEVMEHFRSRQTREESDAMVDRIEAHFDEHGYGLWVVEIDEMFAGFTGLAWAPFDAPFTPAVEVGWRLARAYWGRGIASEAATAALEVGLTRIDSIVSFTALTNLRSQRVMERIGMRREQEFDHTLVDTPAHLRPHVLYRADRTTWTPWLAARS